jgi:hypothetical protein
VPFVAIPRVIPLRLILRLRCAVFCDASCPVKSAVPSSPSATLRLALRLVELDIRAIKITLGLDVLRCKSPEMVRREIWTGLLAYNLIRQTMLQAALQAGCCPRQLSFAAALQKIAASWSTIVVCEAAKVLLVIEVHLADLATHRVGDRPNRVEPRAIKRRPKPQPLLTQPRRQARAALCAGADE